MNILILHPEDSPRYGPWASQKWDLIVDLGKSSESVGISWQELCKCPILMLESFRHCIEDARLTGDILRTGRGHLVDNQGLDWWELTSLFVHSEVETAILLRRLVEKSNMVGRLFATQDGWIVRGLALLLGREVRIIRCDSRTRHHFRRYHRLLRTFSVPQLQEILLDKYDGGYRWRGRFARRRVPETDPVVLLPSGYTNVSRMCSAYARILPEQRFLLVATRNNAVQFERPSNVDVASLSEYAVKPGPDSEYESLFQKWKRLKAHLSLVPELALLCQLGVMDSFPRRFQNGLAARDAWINVLDHEPVTAVLCGDDSNWYTRLPVSLARTRGLPTVDFHHGAFDGRFLMKDIVSDVYLAKSEMEQDYLLRVCCLPADRVVLGAPLSVAERQNETVAWKQTDVIFFSEPYESTGGRQEEVYRELLPPLCRLANENGRRVVVKLHPFENATERSALLDRILGTEQRHLVCIVSGPLTQRLLAKAWFGITVQSTSAADCVEHGVPCFLCAWVTNSPYGYIEQYARFKVGILLRSAQEISGIPVMLSGTGQARPKGTLGEPIVPKVLRRLLDGSLPAVAFR